jgi:hypothetical protein
MSMNPAQIVDTNIEIWAHMLVEIVLIQKELLSFVSPDDDQLDCRNM